MANDFKRFTVSSATTSTGASGDGLYSCHNGSGSSVWNLLLLVLHLQIKQQQV